MPLQRSRSRSIRLIIAALLASCVSSSPAIAQSAPAQTRAEGKVKRPLAQTRDATVEGNDAASLEAIKVTDDAGGQTIGYQPISSSSAMGRDTPLIDIPQSVNVVSQQVLKDQGAQTIDDALNNVSGITQANTLGGNQDAIIKRGFGENRDGSVLTNGLRTALPRSFNVTTERVEVLKGPSSALFGILDPGGMVNVITKKPKQEFGGSVGASASSFGGGLTNFDVTGAVSNTDFAYRLIGEYENTDHWREYGKTKQWIINPSLTWFGDSTTVTAAYTRRNYNVPFDRGTIFDLTTKKPVNVDRKTRFDEPYNITDGKSDLTSLSLVHDFDNSWKLDIGYSYSTDAYTDNQARLMGYNAKTGALTRRADATNASRVETHAVRADLSGDVDIAGLRNEVLVGASYDNYHMLRTNMIRCPQAVDSNIHKPSHGKLAKCTRVSAFDSDQTEKQSTASVYAQDSLHVTDQLIVVGGLRYQYYEQIAGKGRPFVTNTDVSDGELIPRAGVVYKLTPDASLYANAAKSFRPQSSISSYFGALPPEIGTAYEIGSKFEIADGLTATAALFHIEKENVAYFEIVDGIQRTKTAGMVRSQGFEFDIAGQITADLSMIASYGYTDVRIISATENVGAIPVNVGKHTASLFATYTVEDIFDGNTLRIGAGIRGASKRAAINNNGYFLPAYAVVDAFAAYTLETERPVTVQLNLKNIFDKTYFTSSLGGSNLGNQFGEPFKALLSAKVDF